MRVGVIGAGHAGVEAAAAAAAFGAQVTLFSAEPVLPYFRPRLVALAFGQVDEVAIRMHPAEWYKDKGITLRLDSRVTSFNAQKLSIVSCDEEQAFDGIVLATGANPIVPGFAAGAPGHVLPLWTAANAGKIGGRLGKGCTVAIIGGGAIGIESALRAAAAGYGAVIVEKAGGLMSCRLAPAASEILLRRLAVEGINIRTGTAVLKTEALADGRLRIGLDHGEPVEALLAILCVGARGDIGLAQRAGLKTSAGIVCDRILQSSERRVFVCGDIADVAGAMSGTAGEASAQGKTAGANMCAAILDGAREMLKYARRVQTVSIKVGDFEMHVAGQPAGDDCNVSVLDGGDSLTCRLLIEKLGRIVGVQMIGTNRDLRKYVEMIDAEG